MSTARNAAEDALPKVTIDWNDMHQTIDGFGVAQTGDAPIGPWALLLYNFPEPQRSQIMDLAFSQANGIGLTIFRSQIQPRLEPSQGIWDYTDPAQVWIMKQAVNRGPVKLIASVWSPPAWMKDPENIVGGELKPENYQDFAEYLSRYASEYASANEVDIYAVSLTNEPNAEVEWDSCTWNSDQIASFLADYLSPTFAAKHIAAKVIAPETSEWNQVDSYLSATYNNPTALSRVDIVAGHLYGGDASLALEALNHGKTIWQTEVSMKFPVFDIEGTLLWAALINQSLTGAQVSAWIWWSLAMLPNNGSPGDNQLLISLDDSSAGHFTVSKTFWALGNFSRFIRPGFVRIGTKVSNASNLDASAYKNPTTGQFVIVAINKSDSDIRVNFETEGFAGGNVTPYVTSNELNLEPQPTVSLAHTIVVPAQSIVSYIPTVISFHRPDGMVLSTDNLLYFTAHDAFGAYVFRTGQDSYPGQEIALYQEPPGNRFGDIIYAEVGGVWYGYFWAMNSAGQSVIKRILLTGSPTAKVLTPPITNVDIVNSHHNLATDGVHLFWQDVSSVKKMPIGGGPITTLDPTTPSTPTAGVYLRAGEGDREIIYASLNAVRHVPVEGANTNPAIRTIVHANAPVTTILLVADGIYWGDRSGTIQMKVGGTISTIQPSTGLVPTSIGTNGFTAGGALMWTQCGSSGCEAGFNLPGGSGAFPIANNALGALMNSSGNAFWGDDSGLRRLF
jgi:glucuronoarabinoxylan endo-1,4-beta-xylanase